MEKCRLPCSAIVERDIADLYMLTTFEMDKSVVVAFSCAVKRTIENATPLDFDVLFTCSVNISLNYCTSFDIDSLIIL